MPKLTTKFKHVFCDNPKAEVTFQDIPKPNASGEGNYISASATHLAYAGAAGGGPIYYHKLQEYGRANIKTKANVGAKVMDLQFNPFIDTLIGAVTESGAVVTAMLPGEESKEDCEIVKMASSEGTEGAHTKKVHLLDWHPTANGVMATAAWDRTVKLWSVGAQSCEYTIPSGEPAYSLKWNANGTLLGLTNKKQACIIVDPRQADAATTIAGFCEGKKSSKIFWAEDQNLMGFTCFSKQAKRMVQIRDIRKLSDNPLYNEVYDQQSSVLMPYYDEDTQILFLAGKGDSSVFYKQLRNDGRYMWDLAQFATSEPQKGGCWVPKRAMSTSSCEIARFLKITDKKIAPCSFIVPRKTGADIFQDDIYPDARSGLPSCTADEYLQGADADKLAPLRSTMNPANKQEKGAVQLEKKATYAELAAENEELKKKIAELEAQLAGNEE